MKQDKAKSQEQKGLSRRRFLQTAGLALGTGVVTLGAYTMFGRAHANMIQEEVSAMPSVKPVSISTASGIKIHGVQTGWIGIKSSHYKLKAAASLRLPSIMTDTRWAEPKPLLSWVIEHPEGLIVIDSNERAGSKDLGSYLACADPATQFFITRNFSVHVERENELGAQLSTLGLASKDVRWLLQTHLHFDHADGFDFFPDSEIIVARAELEGQQAMPQGAIRCLYPAEFNPVALDYNAQNYDAFPAYYALTQAEDVIIVPTPGHSYGHQSVLLRDNDQTFFFAGDVTFDERQLLEGEMAGIVHNVPKAKNSMTTSLNYIKQNPSIYLPSHDPASLKRLANQQITEV